MQFPELSVVIPSYNRFKYLLNAIESINLQCYDNLEIVVVNDGSDDPEYQTHKFQSNVKVIHLEQNQKEIHGFGPGSIRNFGINEAQGEYIAFLDDDDVWLPNKLNIQLERMLKKNLRLSSTEGLYGEGVYDASKKYQIYNKEKYIDDLKHLYRNSFFIKNNKLPEVWNSDFTEIHNCFITSSVIVEKNIINEIDGFRNLPRWADYDCWKRLQQRYDSLYIDTPLVYFDGLHGDGRNYIK